MRISLFMSDTWFGGTAKPLLSRGGNRIGKESSNPQTTKVIPIPTTIKYFAEPSPLQRPTISVCSQVPLLNAGKVDWNINIILLVVTKRI